MASSEHIFKLSVDSSNSSTEAVRKSLENWKKQIIQTEIELKALRTATKGNGEAQLAAVGQFAQLETKLKDVKAQYAASQRSALGMKSFTQSIGAEFAKAVGPLEGFLGHLSKLGPMGTSLNSLAGTVGDISGSLNSFFASSKKGADDLGKVNKTVEKTGDVAARTDKEIDDLVASMGGIAPAAKKGSDALDKLDNSAKDIGGKADGMGKLSSFTTGIGKAAGGAVLGITALVGGIAALGVGIGSSVEAYDGAIKAQTSLEQALGHTSQALLDQASAMQATTGFADDAITQGQAFAASLGLTEQEILKLTPAVLDLAAATGQDVGAAFEAVSSTLVGGRDALKKYGIELDSSAEKSDKIAQAIEGLNNKFAGQAEAIGNAGSGGIKKFQNTVDDLQESLGAIIVRGIGPFVEGLTEGVGALADWIEPSQELNRELKVQRDSIVSAYGEGQKLANRYDELAKKTNKTDEEQNELNGTMKRLSELFPSAITGWNKYGEAVGISSGKVREHLGLLNQELKTINAKEIRELEKALDDLQNKGEVNLPDLGVVFDNKGVSLQAAKNLVTAMDDIRKGSGDVSKQMVITTQNMDGASESFALYEGKILKLGKGQNDFAKLAKDSNQDLAANEDAVRKFAARLDGFAGRIQDRIKELDGTDADAELKKLQLAEEEATKAANAATAAYENQSATLEQLTAQRKVLVDDLAKIAESDKKGIAAKTAEIASVDKRIAAFKLEGAAAKTANASVAESYRERSEAINAAYDLEISKIDEQEERKYITAIEADSRRNEALSKSLADRIKMEEDAALKSAKGGVIDMQAKITINGLEQEKAKVDAAVEKLRKDIEKAIQVEQQRIDFVLELGVASLEKDIADAVAVDDLKRSFDDAFAGVSDTFGASMQMQLKQAALAGTIDFAALEGNLSLFGDGKEREAIEELKRAYQQFQLETQRNKIILIQKQDQAELDVAKEKLAELQKQLLTLTAEKDRKVAMGIAVPQADLDELEGVQKDVTALEGKVVEVSVKVNTDTTQLVQLDAALGKVQQKKEGDGETPDKPKFTPATAEGGIDSMLQSFGLDAESSSYIAEAATNLASEVNDILLSAQQARIDRAYELESAAAQAQYDANIGGLQAALASGAITQQEFDQRSEQAQKEFEARKLAAQKKAFEQKKKLDLAQVKINLAVELGAIAASLASLGPAGIGMAVVQGAIAIGNAAVRSAAIQQQTFATGGIVQEYEGGDIVSLFNSAATSGLRKKRRDISDGVVLNGPSHADGGVKAMVNDSNMVEMEGGEAVINKKSTKAFAPILSYINSFGGWGKKFATGGVVTSTPMPSFKAPTFAGGGIPSSIVQGSTISLIPSENVIASRQQLERSLAQTEQPRNRRQDPIEVTSTLVLSQLDRVQSRMKKNENTVQYG